MTLERQLADVKATLAKLEAHESSIEEIDIEDVDVDDAAFGSLGELDLLIATDCISEGQNLQDCDTLINYDIHWKLQGGVLVVGAGAGI